jgi:hypothetical protein
LVDRQLAEGWVIANQDIQDEKYSEDGMFLS